jgi:serine/threonine-protein kinase
MLSAMVRPGAAFQPPHELGSYRVYELLGRGGMASVYRGEHALLERPVAIKFLRPDIARSPDAQQRFLREARLVARLAHPNIVTLFDFGVLPDGTYYQASELVAGQTLRELLRSTRLPPAQALGFARQLALGLASAHELGIVHRDLKPSNIMVVPDGAQPDGYRLKILDFGIAKLVQTSDAPVTHAGVAIGTPGYMSPEQCRGDLDIGPATDIYSLGVVMFAMLCGAAPFDAADTDRLLDGHLHDEPPAPSHLIACAPEVDALVLACLAKSPRQRPQSMAEIIASLDRLAGARGERPAPGELDAERGTAKLLPAPRLVHLGFEPNGATGTETVTNVPSAATTVPDRSPRHASSRRRRRRIAWAAGLAIAAAAAAAIAIAVRASSPSPSPSPSPEAAPSLVAPITAPTPAPITAPTPAPPAGAAPTPAPPVTGVPTADAPVTPSTSESKPPAKQARGSKTSAKTTTSPTKPAESKPHPADKPRDRVFETARY